MANHDIVDDPGRATIHSDNLESMQAAYRRLSSEGEKKRFSDALLKRLDPDSGYARVAYLTVATLWKICLPDEGFRAVAPGVHKTADKDQRIATVAKLFDGWLRYRHPDFLNSDLDALEQFANTVDIGALRILKKLPPSVR